MVRLAILVLVLFPVVLGCRGSNRSYPSKPVTIICPWSAGGGTDRLARFWAEALQRELGSSFNVTNKTGGAGGVGHRAGADAAPDGYTLTMITFELSTMHHMGIAEVTHEDFACVMQVNADPAAIVVRRDSPWQTLRALLDDVAKRPGEIKMSGTSRGGAWDLARAGLLIADGQPVDNLSWIPTQGAAPSIADLLAGKIEAVCCSVPEAASSLDQLRVLAVMSDERLPEYPDIPTVHESGIEWSAAAWRGLAVPRQTPAKIQETLETACAKISKSPEYAQFMKDNGFSIAIRSSEQFVEFLRDQDERWKDVIDKAGFAASTTP